MIKYILLMPDSGLWNVIYMSIYSVYTRRTHLRDTRFFADIFTIVFRIPNADQFLNSIIKEMFRAFINI